MFDIGFSELLVIGVVALLVIGPERLPRVARTAGHMLGRLQRYVQDVKADIDREVAFEELRRMRQSVEQTASQFESAVQGGLAQAERDLNAAASTLVEPAAAPSAPPAGPPAGGAPR